MKQGRGIRIIIIAANLALAVVCLVAYVREDKVKPEFMFQASDFLYTESVQTEELLRDIRANDDRDGDITERIVIEKVTENRDSSTAVVYYAVSDSAGNVAKISRAFPAVFDETVHEEAAQTFAMAQPPKVGTLENQAAQGGSGKNNGEEPETADDAQAEADEGKEDTVETGHADSREEPGDAGQEDDGAAEDPQEADAEDDGQEAAGETEDRRDETAEDEENARQREQQTQAGSGAPVLTVRKEEVTIDAGTTPPWTEIIETLRDDKDDYATLYYNLSISRFNRNQPGDYSVTLYTEDSDGNRSGTVTVLVHVRGNG